MQSVHGAARLRHEAEPFATTGLGAVPGQISVTSLRPAYVQDASLGAPPFAPY
ncbi:MAG: hypothetical protein ABI895_21105 [Deltaproteobacteria bacterium]